MVELNVKKFREDFSFFENSKTKGIVYFDNAATSLKPKQVIKAVSDYYSEYPANIHRGLHKMSSRASQEFEESHKTMSKFINAKEQEIFYTRNTTESINLVMRLLLEEKFFQKDDEILLTEMEHHSNLFPWLYLRKFGVKVKFAKLNENFELDLDNFHSQLTPKTRLVAVTHVSNTLGTINPVKGLAKISHDNSSLFLVDSAQGVPRMPVNVKKIGCDFLAFSGHKMLAPTGIGVLYAANDFLDKSPPFFFGGGTIENASIEKPTFLKPPEKFEAGTPHIAGGIGLMHACNYLKKVGLENIQEHESKLVKHALHRLSEIPEINVFGTLNPETQTGIVLFESKKISCHDLALALDESFKIAVRSGMHCAQPLIESLNFDGLVRASFYFYNTIEEVDFFIESLKKLLKVFG
ncbi:MAG: cysteine desulfurase [archaeon]